MATQGWQALDAEGRLPATAWRKERQWALDMGLPARKTVADRDIPTFAAASWGISPGSTPS